MNQEIWKSLDGLVECGKYYEVSNLGNVRSVDHTITDKRNAKRFFKGKILKQKSDKDGYKEVILSCGSKVKHYRVHRLVALAFIPNPNNQPLVNHRDECKDNNVVSNLEWCDNSYNVLYNNGSKKISDRQKGGKNHQAKAIYVFKYETNELIGYFETITYACSILNLDDSCTHKVLKGKYPQHKGYYFEYA